jgi:putative membrane protein
MTDEDDAPSERASPAPSAGPGEPTPEARAAAHAARRRRIEVASLYGAERSLLAWVRTGVSLMTFGFVMGRFGVMLGGARLGSRAQGSSLLHGTAGGVALVVVGGLVCVLAAGRYVRTYRAVVRGDPPRPTMHGPAAIALGAAAMGAVAVLVLLLAFFERSR